MARERIFAALIFAALTVGLAPQPAHAGDATPAKPAGTLSRARQLLRAGQTAEAERLVRDALEIQPDDSLLCLAGEIHFRLARFPEALRSFSDALARNPDNARAHWGLGRLDQLHFRHSAARDHFSRAFSLNARDIEITLSYSEFVSDPAARATLLRNVALLARQDQPERADHAVSQLRIIERLQGRAPARLASPYTAYRLPLTGFHPAGSHRDGVLIAVRINNGKPLHLLVDTGARGLLIDARSARNLDLETISASGLRGFGDNGSGSSHRVLARKVSFGNLDFDECLLEVSDRSLTDSADGIVGLDLFQNFLIRLNLGAHLLELAPFDGPARESPAAIPAIGIRNLLFVNARLEGGGDGLYLVDTGAAFSSVARNLVPLASRRDRLDLQGAQGLIAGAVRVAPLDFQIGGRALRDPAPVAIDLRQISQNEGVEISGILGYSALGRSSLIIDFRHGTVEIAKAH